MDKNTILGLVLMVVVVLLFSWWMQPTPEQLEAQRRYNDSIAAVEAERMAEAALAETPVSTDTVSGEVADSLKRFDSAFRRVRSLCRRFGRIYYFVQ